MTMYRQGDILLDAVDALPAGAVRRPRDAGRVILAYGEVTGHAHAFATPTVEDYAVGEDRYVEITVEPAMLLHEEHAPIPVPPGVYRVRRQREYTPEEIRTVAD